MTAEGLSLPDAAQHEAGHSVTRWVLDCPFDYVTLNGPRGVPVTWPLPGQVILSGPSMLIAMCGAIADYQRRGLTIKGSQIKLLILGGADTFEIDDPATGNVIRPRREWATAPGADLHYMSQRAARDHWPPTFFIGMWRDAERFAAQCRPAIDAVAEALLREGRLPYADVATLGAGAMDGQPEPDIPSWVRT